MVRKIYSNDERRQRAVVFGAMRRYVEARKAAIADADRSGHVLAAFATLRNLMGEGFSLDKALCLMGNFADTAKELGRIDDQTYMTFRAENGGHVIVDFTCTIVSREQSYSRVIELVADLKEGIREILPWGEVSEPRLQVVVEDNHQIAFVL